MKKLTALVLLCGIVLTAVSQNVYYVRTQATGFWETNFQPDPVPGYMNTVFGGGNWTTANYETLTAATIFSCNTRVVYLEGSDNGADELNALMAGNATLIETWVNDGGQLLINAAPNEGGNFSLGFGGVLLSYGGGTSSTSAAVTGGQGAHPIFNGPFASGSAWTGGSFAHATLSGGGITNLITGNNGVVMAEKVLGTGKVLFGTMTWPIPSFQSPQPDATNLRLNMLSYVNNNLVNCAAINTVNVSQLAFCAGDNLTVSYTTTPTFFGGNVFTAQLSDASGSFASPVNIGSLASTGNGSINATIPANTVFGAGYRVRVVSSNPVRTGPVNNIDIIISPRPVANFGFSAPACAGEPVSFRDSSTVSSGSITSHNYNMGDGGLSNLSNPVYAYPLAGTYNVTLTVGSNLGCSHSATKSVTVNSVPVAAFSASNNCLGEATAFNNSSSNTSSVLWQFGDGNTSSAISPSHTYTIPGTYTVTLIASAAGGCNDTVQQLVTIYPKPDADFSFVSACPNDAVQFTNLSTVNGGTLTSAWIFGDGNTGNTTSPSNTYVFQGNYNVRLIVTSNFSCSDTVIKQVEVYPVPVVDFNVPNVCLGTPSVFDNTSSIASGTMNFVWDFDDATTSIDNSPVKTYTATGDYDVELTATSDNGCTASLTKQHRVFDQPVTGFFADNVCWGDSMQFTNTTVGTSVSFQWSFGDGFFSAASNPAHLYNAPGTYTVQLISTNLTNCADTFSTDVTVYPQPVVAYTGYNVCFGTDIVFDNLTTISSGTLNYTWDFGDGTTSFNPEPVKNYTIAGTYLVELLAVSNNGCADSLMQSFTVFPQPVADFSMNNVCFGDSVFFTNNSQGTGITFNWDFGDGNTDTTTAPIHFYAAAGDYTVQLIVTNGSCADTLSKTVSVYPTPVSAFSANDVCFGNATVFTNQSTITQGTMNYEWTFGDGNSSINPSPSHTYQTTGAFTVTLVASSNNGCTDTSILMVNVFEQPVAAFTAANVCFGNAVEFQNNSTDTTNATFTWYFGDGNTSNDVSLNYFYGAAGTYTASLVVSNPDGCRDSVSKSVTVYATPVAEFTVNNVCLGNATNFVNQTTISSGTMSFWWDFDNGTTSSDINPNYIYDSISIYNTTLIATSNDGCADTITKTNAVFPYPVASFTANVACYGQPVLFSNTTTIEFGSNTYEWTFGDGNNSTDVSPLHSYNALGAFNVKLVATSDQGCVNETSQFITVYPFPSANFMALPVCENDTVRFTNLSFIGSGNLSYFWQMGDGSSSQVFEPQHAYSGMSGNIAVTLIATSDFGCSDTITKDIIIYPAPIADFAFRNACDGESVKLTNTSTVSSGSIQTNFWDFGDTEVSMQTSPEKIYATTGTYDIKLTVTSDKGCVGTIVKAVVVYPLPDATIRPLGRHPFCFGDSVILSAGTLVDTYEWSNGATTQTITINYADYFEVTVTSQHGCVSTDGFNTIVYSLPPANAGNDTTISKGFDAFLNGSGGVIYEWSPTETLSDAFIAKPVASPLETTTYTLTVTDANQCKNYDDVVVNVDEDYLLLVTNVITPNKDGANDKFEIINIETYPDAELLIYDRWGSELYVQMPYNNDWDGTYEGKDLPDGTYYYVIRFKGVEKLYKGSVSILR